MADGAAQVVEEHLAAELPNDEKSSTQDEQSSGYQTPATEVTAPIQSTNYTDTSKRSDDPVKEPFPHSLESCKPVSRPALTPEQETKYEELFGVVSGWTTIPLTSARGSATEPLADDERMWLSRECLLRYLRATSWSVQNASKRILNTLTWRREYGATKLDSNDIAVENETGKQVILGFDIDARPCLYMNPGRQNTDKSDRQIQHLVFMLERLIDLMEPGQENSALLINFKNSSSSKSPSVGQGRQVLSILQGHYPERLGKALISDLPWYITTFFKLISPFIDPVTKEKMIFNQPLRNYVPPSQLDKDYGGDVIFEYEHSIYWPSLVKMCEERRAAYKQRWESAGKRLGEYEAYLRGGDQKSLSQVEQEAVESATSG